MRVAWPTDYYGISNSFGFAVHNAKARDALVATGVELDADAPIAVHVVPPHRFEPLPGKLNVAYIAWEANELPELFRSTLAPADALCVPATFLVEPFQAMFPDKLIRVVPLGVDAQDFPFVDRTAGDRRPTPVRPFRFMWCGAPNARKGVQFIMEAWRAFSEGPGAVMLDRAELYLKTSMPDDAKSKVGVVKHGNIILDDRKVSTRDLASLYQRAHCFVFPSIGEGFGLTPCEAAATGCPVIYTPGTALLDTMPPEGYPVKFRTVDADWSWKDADARGTPMEVHVRTPAADTLDLAKTMLHVYRSPAEAFARGARAAQRIRRDFTWERCGRLLREVVEELTSQASQTSQTSQKGCERGQKEEGRLECVGR